MTKSIEDAKKILQLNHKMKFTVPSNNLYPHQWSWDSGWIVYGYCALNEIKKAEDDYFIAGYDYLKQLIEKELYDTHESEGESNIEKIELVKYSRFINKKYALISKYLHNFYD